MIKKALTFDDVLLVPQYSTVLSRSQVNLTIMLPNNVMLNSPLVPANMRDVIGKESIETFLKGGHLTILHRFSDEPYEEQIKMWHHMCNLFSRDIVENLLCCTVGVKQSDYEALPKLIDTGFKMICVDVAHGDSQIACNMVRHISKNFKNVLLIAGNVATAWGAQRLWTSGASIVKVGIGPGSICTTRKETGCGVPQLTALSDIHEKRLLLQDEYQKQFMIIADGGVKSSGDCVKALCFADMVMIGNLFASTYESPGEHTTVNGVSYKTYHGSSTHKSSRIEGTMLLKPISGKLVDVIKNLSEGIQSGCSYQDCHSVKQLQENPQFVEVTTTQQVLDQNKDTYRN